ncbi:LemA protein [Sphingomonas jejuensis]|uniref:LemA protein n=1 Tax=Sphingomonas jejuensis TaxID=904715 RepID=A0ABX0XM32_9SPHN|nr:LemA family protein [Sphingomonas jejuensis]NJC34294.1 LemA protein [Sphingomonas jejuensis]
MAYRSAALLAPLLLAGCGINSVPTAEEEVKARWADVQTNYQRRADLIPNLANTVRAAGAQERQILTEVTEARARAVQVNVSPEQLNDPAALQRFGQAQGQLSSALNGLRVTVEQYPTLRSNENFLTFQSQLEGTENRIAVAVRDYNEAVRAYNTRIRTFPDLIGARFIHGAEPYPPFQATTPNANVAPEVFAPGS